MDIQEIFAIHTDCAFGKVEEKLIYEVEGNEGNELEFWEFYEREIDGLQVYCLSPSKSGFQLYLTDGKTLYYVDYSASGTKFYELEGVSND